MSRKKSKNLKGIKFIFKMICKLFYYLFKGIYYLFKYIYLGIKYLMNKRKKKNTEKFHENVKKGRI